MCVQSNISNKSQISPACVNSGTINNNFNWQCAHLPCIFGRCLNVHCWSIQTHRGPCMQDSNAQAEVGARTAARVSAISVPFAVSSEIKLLVSTSI